MEIGFLDPDAPKKRKYLDYRKAIKKFLNRNTLTQEDRILLSMFFERRQFNLRIQKENKHWLLNLAGWIRALFRLQPFEIANQDLCNLGLVLKFGSVNERKIRNEYRRRNQKPLQKIERKKSAPVVVLIRKKRI